MKKAIRTPLIGILLIAPWSDDKPLSFTGWAWPVAPGLPGYQPLAVGDTVAVSPDGGRLAPCCAKGPGRWRGNPSRTSGPAPDIG